MSRLAGGMLLSLALLGTLVWLIAAKPGSTPQSKNLGTDNDRATPEARAFDARRAMQYLKDICKIGPRISGSKGMEKQQILLKKHFGSLGATVEFQRFAGRQRSVRGGVDMANIIVSWHPERKKRVLFCSHYDTRPLADQEPDERKWRDPFLSANDGGSGVAFMMELAHHMKKTQTEVGVDFLLVDGEEYIWDPRGDEYLLGSKHFAKVYQTEPPRHRYVAGILLDMIAGPNARFPKEGNSLVNAGPLVQQVWSVAKDLKSPLFIDAEGLEVVDDHVPLNKAKIPTIDIIDVDLNGSMSFMNYPHWHRLSDTPENCSGETMKEVARVLITWLQRIKL